MTAAQKRCLRLYPTALVTLLVDPNTLLVRLKVATQSSPIDLIAILGFPLRGNKWRRFDTALTKGTHVLSCVCTGKKM
jgi:hypothetical protein